MVYASGSPYSPVPETSLRPIVKPGTPYWVAALVQTQIKREYLPFQLAGAVALTLGIAVVVLLVLVWPILAALVAAVIIGGTTRLWRAASPNMVSGPAWRYRGVSITGEAFSLLEDIDARFAYAEKLVDQVPTGIAWDEISSEVQALMWESAGHAARVSALDVEIHELRYASAGTPQAALKRSMEDRRAEHLNMLLDAQREADELAAVAGNAAAAAKVALGRTGSVAALEVVTPTSQGILARAALADARARLELLAQVWTDLDESALLLTDQVDAELGRQRVEDDDLPSQDDSGGDL